MNFFEWIPDEILIHILSFCIPVPYRNDDFMKLASVCRRFRDCIIVVIEREHKKGDVSRYLFTVARKESTSFELAEKAFCTAPGILAVFSNTGVYVIDPKNDQCKLLIASRHHLYECLGQQVIQNNKDNHLELAPERYASHLDFTMPFLQKKMCFGRHEINSTLLSLLRERYANISIRGFFQISGGFICFLPTKIGVSRSSDELFAWAVQGPFAEEIDYPFTSSISMNTDFFSRLDDRAFVVYNAHAFLVEIEDAGENFTICHRQISGIQEWMENPLTRHEISFCGNRMALASIRPQNTAIQIFELRYLRSSHMVHIEMLHDETIIHSPRYDNRRLHNYALILTPFGLVYQRSQHFVVFWFEQLTTHFLLSKKLDLTRFNEDLL